MMDSQKPTPISELGVSLFKRANVEQNIFIFLSGNCQNLTEVSWVWFL